MVRFLFLFLTRFHVNVARSNGNPTQLAFQSYGVMLRIAAEAIRRGNFEDLFNENGGVFSFSSTVDHVCRFAFVGVLILEGRNK